MTDAPSEPFVLLEDGDLQPARARSKAATTAVVAGTDRHHVVYECWRAGPPASACCAFTGKLCHSARPLDNYRGPAVPTGGIGF